MRKTGIITIVVLVVLGVGAYFFLTNPLGGSSSFVRELSMQFMEDLQFKDFRSSSKYHHKLERDRVDIGRALERLFLVKPEMLDIREYRIVKAEVDSTGKRARVHVNTKFQRLNQKNEPEEAELILYWIKRHPDCPLDTTCSQGHCRNAAGDQLYPAKDDRGRPRTEEEVTEDLELEKKRDPDAEQPEPFTCDAQAEPRWFMNLDSTLKEKRYNY